MQGFSNALDVSSISGELLIKTYPTKREYLMGEPLDLTGIQVFYIAAGGAYFDVTNLIHSTPEVGEPVMSSTIFIEYHNVYTYFTIQFGDVQPWSTATVAQLKSAITLAELGQISLTDYWAVGQERDVTLKDGTTKQFVLVDSKLTGLTSATDKRLTFAVAVKTSMGNRSHHSSNTNTNGWQASDIRTWCNGTFKNNIPDDFLSIFKQFVWKQGKGGGSSSGLLETTDTFAIPVEKMLFGSRTYSFSDEAALYDQFEYYETASHRINSQWEASPGSGSGNDFCCVSSGGGAGGSGASYSRAVVPFGCI